MRQAIVSVRDERGEVLGLDRLLDTLEDADLIDVDVLSCEGARGVVRVHVEEPVDESALDGLPAVVWHERVSGPVEGAAYVLEFDAEESETVTDACDDDLLLCGVSDVSTDGLTFEVAGPQDAISDTVGEYERAGASVALESLREYEYRDGTLDALTARQREVLDVAYDMGYFDVPRGATTDDVAAELGVDDSTVAEHLQRAERNLVSTVVTGR